MPSAGALRRARPNAAKQASQQLFACDSAKEGVASVNLFERNRAAVLAGINLCVVVEMTGATKKLLIFWALDRAIWGQRGVSPYGRRKITDGSRGIPAVFYEV